MIDRAIEDLMALLPIEGPPAGEGRVADHLRGALIEIGVPEADIHIDQAQEQSEYGGDTGNLIVRMDGNRGGQRLMFSTHMDTVPDAVGCIPRLDRENNRIVNDAEGRALGGDNRTSCAVLLHLARALVEKGGDHQPITLVFFIQEEVGLVGARGMDLSMLGDSLPEMCFNLDGGRSDVGVTAVIGTERFTIDVTGIASHAGQPGGGVSAAIIAAQALAEIEQGGWQSVIDQPDGKGSANVGIVRGGQGTNVVMPSMHILAEARSHDPAFRKKIIDTWKAAFVRSAESFHNERGENGTVAFGPGPTYEAFALDDDAPVVQRYLSGVKACGMDPKTVSNDGGMDANWIVAHGIPTVTFGAGQRDVHTSDEWIALEDFAAACRLVTQLAEVV